MTQKYIRTAEAVGEVIGDVFPALPASLLSPLNGLANRLKDPQAVDFVVEAPGIETRSDVTVEHVQAPNQQIEEDDEDEDAPDSDAKCLDVTTRSIESDREDEQVRHRIADPEEALAYAIRKAAEAGRFDVLTTLVSELEARRAARAEVLSSVATCDRASQEGRSEP